MPRIVESAPNRIVISNMITTYGGIEPIGLPPSTSGQSYDMYSVIQAPMAQPAIPPISVNIRTGLTGCSSASSISCRGMGEYTVKSVWPARRSWPIASTVASTWPNTPSTPGAGGTSFTSEIDTVGKFFTNNRNHMKNQPKLPAMMPQSAHVGLYVALANRSNGSPASDTTMITKRSNHIPMFTKIEMTNRPVMLVWTFFDQSSHGSSPLQMFIVQLAHQNGPNARYQKAARSWALPLNQATKFSVQYDMLTIRPVKRHSFARFSKWWTVMSSSR